MYSRTVTIVNKSGLHARPASTFVQSAAKFGSKILIKKEDSEQAANAKSIVQVLAQCITKGTVIVLSAEGADEKEAVNTLADMVEAGFGDE